MTSARSYCAKFEASPRQAEFRSEDYNPQILLSLTKWSYTCYLPAFVESTTTPNRSPVRQIAHKAQRSSSTLVMASNGSTAGHFEVDYVISYRIPSDCRVNLLDLRVQRG